MKVTRTFHPVGQGAFYSERFYMEDQQGTVHNIVYECGVKWDYKGKVKHVDSFDVTTNSIDRSYVVPVSFGNYNTYGHPSGKVLAYLIMKDCCIRFVTEMANTVFIEEIEKWR